MECGCIGHKKSRDELGNKTEADKREVYGAYRDFLECQGLEGTSCSTEDFKSKLAERAAYERVCLEKLDIDPNDAEKVCSALNLRETGIGSVDTSTSAGSESMDSSSPFYAKGRLHRMMHWMSRGGGIMLPEAFKARADKIMSKYCGKASPQEPELLAYSVYTSISCGTDGLVSSSAGAECSPVMSDDNDVVDVCSCPIEQGLKEKVLSAYKDFLGCQGLEGASCSGENFESKLTEYAACERAYLEKLGEKGWSALDKILKGGGTDSATKALVSSSAGAECSPVMSDNDVVDVCSCPIEQGLLARSVSSPSIVGGAVASITVEEAKPQVSGTLRALRDKVRERVPFEVRSHIPEVVRKSIDRLIRMSEKSGRERYEEKINNATVARSYLPISSYDTTATKYSAAAMGSGSCEDYVLCKDLFGEEKSQNTPVSCLECGKTDKDFDNEGGKEHGSEGMDFLPSTHSHCRKKDIAKEDNPETAVSCCEVSKVMGLTGEQGVRVSSVLLLWIN